MSLLEHSKQRWKIKVFIGLMALGAGVTLFQSFLYDPLGKELAVKIAIGGMVLIVATFLWTGHNIVCPRCGLKLLYFSITKVGLGTWYEWLVSEEKCPQCGYPGELKPAKSKRR